MWTRRKSATPTVTLETKLVALRAMVGAERMRAEAAFVGEAMPFLHDLPLVQRAGLGDGGLRGGNPLGPLRGHGHVDAGRQAV